MLTRISVEKILRVLQGTSHEGSIADIHKRERRNLLDAQLEDDQKDFDELQGWYNKLLEDYKRLKKERLIK